MNINEHGILKYTTTEDDSGRQVRDILKKKMSLSSRLIKRLKYSDRIFLNNTPVFVVAAVKPGDTISANIDIEEESDSLPEDIEINIIYEDRSLIVLNKQPGIVVHPTRGHPTGTIANGIMNHLLNNGEKKKIRPVSRLDRDTSGIILFAKNEYIQEALIKQMKEKIFKKEYFGIVNGIISEKSGTIDLPIARKPDSIMLRHIDDSGDKSVTTFRVVEYLNDATCLRFNLETGRTHQIRVHCQAIGHPLVGETLYPQLNSTKEKNTPLINRQCLHSESVSFIHPITKKAINLSCDIPEDIKSVLETLRK
ncbi:MAG: RluA family pseudouridine synthase [Clostridia bacterium]